SHQTFVITTHVNPDGDAIGSEVALARFLSDRGKKVTIINQSVTPDHLQFLEEIHPIRVYQSKYDGTILDCECFCVVDTNSPKRFSALADAVGRSRAVKVCIDHHLEQEPFADLYVIDTEVPATCELLYLIMHEIDPHGISKPIADALYTGIMTDTASFRFPKTDSETHQIVSELLRTGVDPYEMYQHVFENGPLNKLQLLGKSLESIQLYHNGRVAVMIIPRSVFQETNTAEADVDNFTSYVLSIKGVRIGLVFVELPDSIKISFRSKGNIAVNELAKQFGGGGHKNASGARIKHSTILEALSKVVKAAEPYINLQEKE
ncbi:MAG: bifunctional oligoribonuclease/PAP phosphatase NrnA, partial [Bacteroidota bacterium]